MRIWETSPRTFGHDLKELRMDERLTQAELSGRIGRSLDYVGKMEKGLRTPDLETLGRIQRVLRIDEVRMVR